MDQQLSDARKRIVQLTAEVQSSMQAAQHHEERTAALQSQVGVLCTQLQLMRLRLVSKMTAGCSNKLRRNKSTLSS